MSLKFLVWAQCSGLDLKGEINIKDSRYLCDKHFLPNYISHQSRRKMLVHTAVPTKWKEDLVIDEGEPKNFTIIAEKTPKAQRSSRNTNSETDSVTMSPTYHNNLKRKLSEPMEEYEYEDEEEGPIAESAEIVEQEVVYEELTLPTVRENPKPMYILVKPRKTEPAPKKIMNYIRPATTQKEGTSFFLTEEGNLASTSVEDGIKTENQTSEKKRVSAPLLPPSAPLENCTEFIFNGEIYVQMPKRVFEAERDRLRAEVERYKEVLKDVRLKIDGILENNI